MPLIHSARVWLCLAAQFGLSTTRFSYAISAAPTTTVALDEAHSRMSRFYSRPFPPQHVTDSVGAVVQHTITVTNVGTIDADDVVLGFIKPPGAGTNGVPLQSLYDFSRVFVPAGKSVSVTLNASALHFTQIGDDGERSMLPGDYVFQFGVPETHAHGQGYATHMVATTLRT